MNALCAAVWTTFLAQSLQVYSEFARFNAAAEIAAPAEPREILSPALVRNGFTSFQIIVRVDPGTPYWLLVGENPEDAVKLTVYRESGDKLEPVALPYSDDKTQIFWLDVWTDRDAPVRRIKVEPELYVKEDWVVYPMEARVMDATVPGSLLVTGNSMCGAKADPDGDVARLHARNAQQDAALAAGAPKEELKKLVDGCESKSAQNPEYYLRIRDYLFRMR
ncbi:MAG TPA: hypothetical protein VK419_08605 [Bryobacteraceae bacterium]|nr:hypothetical protein [Bryobacteraceae bacterium]